MERDEALKFMYQLLTMMVQKNGSDLFITAGFPPAIKIDSKMTPVTQQADHVHAALGEKFCMVHQTGLGLWPERPCNIGFIAFDASIDSPEADWLAVAKEKATVVIRSHKARLTCRFLVEITQVEQGVALEIVTRWCESPAARLVSLRTGGTTDKRSD